MKNNSNASDPFGMTPRFYTFEILNTLIFIAVGVALLIIIALDILNVLLGVGLLSVFAGIASAASGLNYVKNRSTDELETGVQKGYRYRFVTAIACFVAGGALLVGHFIK